MSFPLRFPVGAVQALATVTHPTRTTWILELHNGEDNRLTDIMIKQTIVPALDAVERDWRNNWRAAQNTKDKDGGKGALIIVGNRKQHKFFSNGLDYESAVQNPRFFPDVFNVMMYRLYTFPIPTIAAINGHGFAGGFMLAMCCDYRVMNDGSKRNAWLCMNEVHFGAAWPPSFASVFRDKAANAQVLRKIGLEGHRFTPLEALEAGLIDYLAPPNTEDVIKKAQEVADSVCDQAKMGVWGLIRSDMFDDTIKVLRSDAMSRKSAVLDDAAARARL